jgi:hypothetical protein
LIGTIVMTALFGVDIPPHVAQRPADLVPAVTLFRSFIYAFGCFSVMLFFFVFHRVQKP